MALMDNRKMYYIREVQTEMDLWSVNVQVIEIHRNQLTKQTSQRTYKRYLLADENGTKVSAVLYENDIQHFSSILQQFKRYRISNTKLTPAFGFFKVGDYPFTWVIKAETPVEPIPETVPPPIPFNYTVCPFKDFMLHADKDSAFNIKAVVIHAFPTREINEVSTHREFVIVDESMTPIIMTLWNSYGNEEGKILADNIVDFPEIIGINMKSTTFHGLSIGSRMYSCILINPPLPANESLSQWAASNKAKLLTLVQSRTYKNTDLLLPKPNLSVTIDVPTAFATLPTINSAWVTGQLRFTPTEQQYFVCACANCHRKADTGSDWILSCSACKAHEEVKLRCRVPVELVGGDKVLNIVLTSPDVERLTGLTAEQMRDAHKYDFNVIDDLFANLNKLNVVCFVKKYDPKTMGSHRSPGLRFSAVKTYAIDSIKKFSAETASSSMLNSPELSNDASKMKAEIGETIEEAQTCSDTIVQEIVSSQTGHHHGKNKATSSGEAKGIKRSKK